MSNQNQSQRPALTAEQIKAIKEKAAAKDKALENGKIIKK